MAKHSTPRRNAQARLKRFWRAYDVKSPPYLHPQDKEHIDNFVTLNFDQYQEQFGDVDDSAIHAGLLPKPYEGNLSRADVFILMLNSHFNRSRMASGIILLKRAILSAPVQGMPLGKDRGKASRSKRQKATEPGLTFDSQQHL